MRTEIFSVGSSHTRSFVLFGREVKCESHGLGLEHVISIVMALRLLLLLDWLGGIGGLLGMGVVIDEFFLVFFELEFEAEVGADGGPDIFDELESIGEL